MQACVLTFPTPHEPTLGTFTVNGVVDGRTRTPFQGKWFLIQGGTLFGLDTILYQALDFFHANGQIDTRGAQDLTRGSGAALGERGQGFRVACGLDGPGYPILDLEASTLFGGFVEQAAYVSASRVGEFDFTLTINEPNGDSSARNPPFYLITVLGGDDLSIDFPSGPGVPAQLQNGTFPCSARPAAWFGLTSTPAAALGTSVASGAGGRVMGYGWEARDSGRGTATYVLTGQFGTPSPSPNSGVVCTDRVGASLDSSTGALGSQTPVVSAWNDGTPSVEISGAPVGLPFTPVIFSGDLIRAVAIDFVQDPDPITGLQTIELGIDPRWIMVASEGTTTLNAPSVTKLDHAIGWTDCAEQVGFWTGQDADGELSPVTGARWGSTSSLLRFATANAASTAFDAVMEFVSVTDQGRLTVRWSTDDGGARRVVLFALGIAVVPPSPNLLLTQLPIEALYPYQAVQPLTSGSAVEWFTPPPTRSRRGR